MITRRAQFDDKVKKQIRERVQQLLKEKQEDGGEADSADKQPENEPENQEGTVYLFDASDHSSRSMVALEFDNRKEFEVYKKTHDLKPGTKIKILDEGKGGKKPDEVTKKRGPAKEDEKSTRKPGKDDKDAIRKKVVEKLQEKKDKAPEAPKKDDKTPKETPKKDDSGDKSDKTDKPERQPGELLEHSHPARVPEGMHRQVAIKDSLIDEFGTEAKDWKVHHIHPSQITSNVLIKFPDGSGKKYGELNPDEKARVDKAVGEGLAASKGLNDYTTVSSASFRYNRDVSLARYDNAEVEEVKNESAEPITADNVGEFTSSIRENGRTLLKKYAKCMSGGISGTGGSRRDAEHFVDDTAGAIKEGVMDGSLSGVKQSDLDELVRENLKRMLHQEAETRRRSLGDHGVRHVVGNCKSAMSMLGELQKGGVKITGKHKLMALSVMADHDIGYTVGMPLPKVPRGRSTRNIPRNWSIRKRTVTTRFSEVPTERRLGLLSPHTMIQP